LPSQKVLEQKQKIVADLVERIKGSVAGVVVDYRGISVVDDTAMRKELREAGVEYTVIKNTLLKLATEQTGLEAMDSALEGTTAIATSADDYVVAAKILCKYADNKKIAAIKSGFMDGQVLTVEKVISVGKLPSREVLLATVVGAFQAPIASFARAIQAIVDKSGEEAAPVAEEAAPETPAE